MAQFGHTGKILNDKFLLQFEILFVKAWHAICFRENNNSGSKRTYESEHVNNAFHDVNSILYTATNIHPKARP